jgi:hypothetical protein
MTGRVGTEANLWTCARVGGTRAVYGIRAATSAQQSSNRNVADAQGPLAEG